jgi:mRNA-degrading endonuclease toxin of MazEF toxin-antitoxin module
MGRIDGERIYDALWCDNRPSPTGYAACRSSCTSSLRERATLGFAAFTFQEKEGLIPLDQIPTLDRARMVKRLGALEPVTLASTRPSLQAMFAS